MCAEYDALFEIGHACGHNVIAAAAVGAGVGATQVASELGFEILIAGTPAEETVVGRASHPSLQAGIKSGNALNGIVEAYLALRQLDLGPYEQCAGVITEGGKAPNVVPEIATASYYVRATTRVELESLWSR